MRNVSNAELIFLKEEVPIVYCLDENSPLKYLLSACIHFIIYT